MILLSHDQLIEELGQVQNLVNDLANTEGSASSVALTMADHITAKIEIVRRELAMKTRSLDD